MAEPLQKPNTIKRVTAIEIFSIEEPVELMTTKDSSGRVSQHWRTATYYFTTAERPVTYNGHQHVPLSCFNQVRWDHVDTI